MQKGSGKYQLNANIKPAQEQKDEKHKWQQQVQENNVYSEQFLQSEVSPRRIEDFLNSM